MGPNVLVFAWNRPLPGRESQSAQHFGDFVQYLEGLKGKGAIDAFEAVLLDPYAGSVNGFFLVRGDGARLEQLTASADWNRHVTRAHLHLDGLAVLRGVTGPALDERMGMWMEMLPRG